MALAVETNTRCKSIYVRRKWRIVGKGLGGQGLEVPSKNSEGGLMCYSSPDPSFHIFEMFDRGPVIVRHFSHFSSSSYSLTIEHIRRRPDADGVTLSEAAKAM